MRELLPALALLPAVALGGGTEVQALAEAALEQPETVLGGSLVGPSSARATWVRLGSIDPFLEDEAMALFSTGLVGTPPLPGADLSTTGVEDDFAGVNFSLDVPAWARSLRFAVRIVAPDPASLSAASLLDRARIEVSGDPIALDAWERGDLTPLSTGLRPDTAGLLAGTPYAGSWLTPWYEAVVPVAPFSQVFVSFEARDGGEGDDPATARGDLLMLVDGVGFDEAEPLDVQPGAVPRVEDIGPLRLPENLPSSVRLGGRDLRPDLLASLVGEDGLDVLELGPVVFRSAQQIEVPVPALEPGTFGLRLRWGDSSLTWPELLRIDTPPPSIESVRPDVLPPSGGLAVIEGAGFFGSPSVRVGDITAAVTVVSDRRLEIVVPPGQGTARVLVFADGGSVERSNGILYSAPEPSDEETVDGDGGPTVVECGQGGATGSVAWIALPPLLWRRRR